MIHLKLNKLLFEVEKKTMQGKNKFIEEYVNGQALPQN